MSMLTAAGVVLGAGVVVSLIADWVKNPNL
jgi:hypothetical protein